MTTTSQVREVTRGAGAALTALRSGSMVLLGRVCGCVPLVLRWAWDQASIDPQATATAQDLADRKAVKAAKAAKRKSKKADDEDDHQEDEPEADAVVTAPPVAPVRRPFPEAAGMLAIGGMLAAGGLGTAVTVAGPYLQMLAPWGGVITTVGVLGWMVAAWMLAPPPVEVPEEEHTDGDVRGGDEQTAADRLVHHVLCRLAELEEAGKSGVHVTSLIASAEEEGLIVAGSVDKAAMRAWLDASGLPVTKSVKVQGSVDYGVRVDRVTEALGIAPGEAQARLLGAAVETVLQTPAETPAPIPLPAPGLPAQPPRLTLVKPLPESPSPAEAQGAA